LANWVLENNSIIEQELKSLLFDTSPNGERNYSDNKKALIETLGNLESYATRFSRLRFIIDALKDVEDGYQKVKELLEIVGRANKVHQVLGNIKSLDDYAKLLLACELENVSADVKSFYDILYPTDPIRLDQIAPQKVRSGSPPDYRFRFKWSYDLILDAEPVANLGRLRALLWSFAFALIEKYKPALKTIIIDDPFISLDDYHSLNMIEEIISNKLSKNYQTIVTLNQENLLHERMGRDPYGENIQIARVLTRGENHRMCRIQPSWERLSAAITKYNEDPDNWSDVTDEARIVLENHLKALAFYLLTIDVSSSGVDDILEKLKQAYNHDANCTSIFKHVKIEKLIELYEKDFTRKVVHGSHHGGPGVSNLYPHDAEDVIKSHTKWKKEIREKYLEIDHVIIRKKIKRVNEIAEIAEPLDIENVLNPFSVSKPIYSIGKVAAEGDVSITADVLYDNDSIIWPSSLRFGIVTSLSCRPIVWEGQLALFSTKLAVADGDLALMQTKESNFLRRVHKLESEDSIAWIGAAINPLSYNIKPEIFTEDEVSLYKLVGIIFPDENERIKNALIPGGEVVRLEGKWPRIMTAIAKNGTKLISVEGDSGEPLVCSGQYLIVEDVTSINQDIDMKPCCIVFDDNRALFKRFCFSSESNNKAILQPLNISEPHPVIEANIGFDLQDENAQIQSLPTIKQLLSVRGVLFLSPEIME